MISLKHLTPTVLLLLMTACAHDVRYTRTRTEPDHCLTVCELISCPEVYRNTVVSVRGRVVVGFETFAMIDPSCPADNRTQGMIWLTTHADRGAAWADLRSSQIYYMRADADGRAAYLNDLEWYAPPDVELHQDREWTRFTRLLDKHHSANATVLGRFEYAIPATVRVGPWWTRPTFQSWFGHLNGYSRQLVISQVTNVTRGKPL